ncbi:MAG TPA: hypothetical protein VKT80_10505, partial [Chloroflexota bacterium]|nr:hypothetical protein [Chloroflexota bacterium]
GGALKLLQVGQTVCVQQLEFACKLTILSAGEPGMKVAEVGVDYVVLDDEREGVQTRIPMHVLKMDTGETVEPVPAPVPSAA